jgi:hypothetical protein
MSQPPSSNVRCPTEHSHNKLCCCGGHNHKNVKRNKRHHATRVKLARKKARRGKLREKGLLD